MANANYAPVTSGTAYSALAYIAEQSLGRTWTTQYEQSYPFRRKLLENGRGDIAQVGAASPKMIVPIWMGANVLADVVGVTRANELTAVGNATASDGTQAEVPLALYASKALRFTTTELDYAKGQSKLGRGNIVEGRTNEILDVFERRFATDLYDAGDASQASVMALNFAIATGNTVHGMAQGTYANWQGNVDAVGGAFDIEKFDQHLMILRGQKGAKPDMAIFAAPSGGVDLFLRAKSLLRQDVQVMTGPKQGGTLEKSFQTYIYDGVEFVRDHWATAGEMMILDTSSWVYGGDSKPTFVKNLSPVDNSLYYETILMMRCAIGCKSPRRNYRWTGLTG